MAAEFGRERCFSLLMLYSSTILEQLQKSNDGEAMIFDNFTCFGQRAFFVSLRNLKELLLVVLEPSHNISVPLIYV